MDQSQTGPVSLTLSWHWSCPQLNVLKKEKREKKEIYMESNLSLIVKWVVNVVCCSELVLGHST